MCKKEENVERCRCRSVYRGLGVTDPDGSLAMFQQQALMTVMDGMETAVEEIHKVFRTVIAPTKRDEIIPEHVRQSRKTKLLHQLCRLRGLETPSSPSRSDFEGGVTAEDSTPRKDMLENPIFEEV